MAREKQLFSFKEAGEYLGIPLGTWRHWYYNDDSKVIKGRKFGKTLIFSRAQLDDFKANGWQTEIEANDTLYSGKQAAEYLGTEYNALMKHVERGNIDGQLVANRRIFTRTELDEFEAGGDDRRRGQEHGNADLTEDQVREMKRLRNEEKWSLSQLAEKYGIDESHASRIVRGLAWSHVE